MQSWDIISSSFFLFFLAINFNLQFQSQCNGQNLDPSDIITNEELLNQTQRKVKYEVMTAKQELFDQVEVVRKVTRAYIGAKIKENLFTALKAAAEKELETISMQNRPRQPRQDEDDDDVTQEPEVGIIPQLATIVQAIFGQNVNVTKYAENASKLLPKPIGNQLINVASILDPNQFTSTLKPDTQSQKVPITPPPRRVTNNYSTPQTPPPPPLVISGNYSNTLQVGNDTNTVSVVAPSPPLPPSRIQQVPLPPVRVVQFLPSPPIISTETIPSNTEDDDDDGTVAPESDTEDDNDDNNTNDKRRNLELNRVKRQFNFKGLNPMKLLDGFEALWKNYGKENTTDSSSSSSSSLITTTAPTKYTKAGSTTETDDGFDDDYTTKPSRVNTAVKGVQTQVDALRKGVPDLFQGAREAYKFLEHLNGFLDSWENRLLAGTAADDE